MKNASSEATIVHIRVDQISVVNPRVRNRRIFREIVSNIAELGLNDLSR